MKNRVLLDTNTLVRLTVRDYEPHYIRAKELFLQIENGEIEAELLDIIIAEIIYVLHKVYKYKKDDVVSVLIKVLEYSHIIVENRNVVYHALKLFENKNIDFADAMLCAKKNLQGYEVMSFDKDIKRC